jgi:hypothetical protein
MKRFSDNIIATAGPVPVQNLNAFVAVPGESDYASFARAMSRAATGIGLALAEETRYSNEIHQASVALLSAPRISPLGNGQYRIDGGLFFWNGMQFDKGAEFSVSQANGMQILTPDLVHRAALVPAAFNEMKYDTYNASPLDEIEDQVLSELDVTIDRAKVQELTDPEGDGDYIEFSMVKYMSIYAPSLSSATEGRAIALASNGGSYASSQSEVSNQQLTHDPEDTSYLQHLLDARIHYDEFMVQFIDKANPFAYVTMEVVRDAKVDVIGSAPDGLPDGTGVFTTDAGSTDGTDTKVSFYDGNAVLFADNAVPVTRTTHGHTYTGPEVVEDWKARAATLQQIADELSA